MARAAPRPLVLVVEDEPLLRMDAVDMIRQSGFDVVEASNADEAIVLLETRLDIELVFTDIDMPGSMNGIKLAHALAAFGIDAAGAIALDLGAAAGGFTQALLDAGAARVYAVDAGAGQLRGWLRADPRVITMDLSYLAIADAIGQLKTVNPQGQIVSTARAIGISFGD